MISKHLPDAMSVMSAVFMVRAIIESDEQHAMILFLVAVGFGIWADTSKIVLRTSNMEDRK